MKHVRNDYVTIASLVPYKAKVLDVGCGNGDLLTYLYTQKHTINRGIELSVSGVSQAVSAGHSVIQGDADTDLGQYPTNAFDVVILSKTLQATQNPAYVLEQITRIGKVAIVGFSNFGHYSVLWDLLAHKRMPVTRALPISWYETPNIHFCTIHDFVDLCTVQNLDILTYKIISQSGKHLKFRATSWLSSVFGADAVFVIANSNTPI